MNTPPATDVDTDDVVAMHVIVEGVVQGVGFRDACVDEARALGLAGWVRNRRDGTVEATMQGRREAVTTMQGWLRHGPRWAKVKRVVVTLCAVDEDAPEAFERRPTV